jgi:hypothetical protein
LYVPQGIAGLLASLAAFALVYAVAARIILREEYSYVMRAILRRRTA